MRRWQYQIALGLIAPWLVWDAWRRYRHAPRGDRRLFEQFGRLRDGLPQGALWLHAVSLGETRAAAMLVDELRSRWPDLPIVLSTTTETGAEAARSLGLPHFYAPYDYAFVQRQVLRQLTPRAMVVMETELWPNLVREANRRSVPMMIANARLSDRSFARYRRWGGPLLREVLAGVGFVCAQSDQDRDRFAALGAPRVADCGNLKFDLPVAETIPAVPAARAHTWLAASTHPGEEKQVLAAHARVRERFPDAQLILVPRHPERAAEVMRMVEAAGLSVARWEAAGMPERALAVAVVDRAGVLAERFGEVPVVFMGGSLEPVGGHNPLEPAAVGRAVLSGPYVSNFRAVFAALGEAGGERQVRGADTLAAAVIECFENPADWAVAGERARAVIAGHRGAAARLADRLAAWIEGAAG
ncbi:3-deoxy-D-manno-octulosonic acid transferase [Guyparkeria hydrothermalis]|uniref:3-deoxy-D-manno-octulosonic acid transferase n=1 Tax=Guyparkeria hydrothermalis TaxID=923 RepID=UPI0024C32AF7|nr:3-deoxy-D-manno-octulosonic acid transferase [Guyparkeria hydrothermalis]